ncbi:ubiquitin-associated domain-containing protein 2-like [Actinia tenebrosa]|uniref:Ubiquitin-associated domain-containing protein 2-like n=1 Tax=Actinia tenebrosa TaxID=6105 RepID=A0A6P8HJJ7_ACTTE|nr:ubiquitin-associated domain-containing protein 2-like [Actinia tenebrosa]
MSTSTRTVGFVNSPITKTLLLLNGSASLVNILLGSSATKKIISGYHWLQVVTHTKLLQGLSSTIYFSSARDLLCGSILLYAFRIFERRQGSGKYASYVFASTVIAAGLQLITVYGLKHYGYQLEPLPSGLYGMIFATLVRYFFEIPSIDAVMVIGIPISGKVLNYSVALQMLLGSRESFIAGVCGMAAGLIYKSNLAYVQSWLKLPGFIVRLFSRVFGSLFQSTPEESPYPFPLGATVEIQEQQQMEWYEQQMIQRAVASNAAHQRTRSRAGQGYAEVMVPPANGLRDWLLAPPRNHAEGSPLDHHDDNANQQQQPMEEISEDQVRSLVEMGFARQDVLHALSVTNNDINNATSVLLSNSTQF